MVIRTRCPAGATASPASGKPTLTSRHELAAALPLSGGGPLALSELRGRRAVAFAGIAEPDSFFSELRAQGIDLVKTVSFADHTPYTEAHLSKLLAVQQESGASLLLTTEKDGVKLHDVPDDLADDLYLVRLELVFDDPAQLTQALRNLLQQ